VKTLQLFDKSDGGKILINLEHIMTIAPLANDMVRIAFVDGSKIDIKKNFEDFRNDSFRESMKPPRP